MPVCRNSLPPQFARWLYSVLSLGKGRKFGTSNLFVPTMFAWKTHKLFSSEALLITISWSVPITHTTTAFDSAENSACLAA